MREFRVAAIRRGRSVAAPEEPETGFAPGPGRTGWEMSQSAWCFPTSVPVVPQVWWPGLSEPVTAAHHTSPEGWCAPLWSPAGGAPWVAPTVSAPYLVTDAPSGAGTSEIDRSAAERACVAVTSADGCSLVQSGAAAGASVRDLGASAGWCSFAPDAAAADACVLQSSGSVGECGSPADLPVQVPDGSAERLCSVPSAVAGACMSSVPDGSPTSERDVGDTGPGAAAAVCVSGVL